MFQKIIALILSILMTLSSFLGLGGTQNSITLGEFQAVVYEAFGMSDDMGIITCDDSISPEVTLTGKLCYNILKQVSNNEFIKSGSILPIKTETALNAVYEAQKAWATKSFGSPEIETLTEDEVRFQGDFEPALEVAEIKTGTGLVLQAPYVPLESKTAITQSQIDLAGLLQKLDVSFSISGFDFGVKVTDTGFNLNVATNITTGVNLQKSYEVTNLNIATKFDGNLATKDIKEAYIRADYDLKDVTKLTGSYATSLAVTGDTPMDIMTAAKASALALMPGGNNKITVFTINVPIPNLPAVTVSLDVNLRITVNGKIEITIESSNVKGLEILNNKVRIINETIYNQQTFDIMADIRFTVGLCFSIKLAGYILIDAEFEIGVGIKVSAYIATDTAVYVLEMPLDLAINIPYPCGGMDGAEFCGNAKIYGLMYVSIGQNSQLMKLVGLKKTWTIFDESNAVIYNLHIEETGIVDACTRART